MLRLIIPLAIVALVILVTFYVLNSKQRKRGLHEAWHVLIVIVGAAALLGIISLMFFI